MSNLVPPPPNYPPMVPTPPAAPIEKTPSTKRRTRRAPKPVTHLQQHLDHRPRLRVVAYNATAAAAGWQLGVGPWMHEGITHYGTHDVARGVWVGVGLAFISLLVEAKAHGWRGPHRPQLVRALGWAGRIPLASALVALALYGPDAAL